MAGKLFQQFYAASLVMGCLVSLDALIYLISPLKAWHSAFALLELLWLLTNLLFLPFAYKKTPVHPALFLIGYEFIMYGVISRVMTQQQIENLQFPDWYIFSVLCFGLFYVGVNLRILQRMQGTRIG